MGRSNRRILELLEQQRYEGSGTEYLSDPGQNGPLGEGECVVVHTDVFRVGNGTSATATLTLIAEDSPDGQNWAQVGSAPFVNGTNITWNDTPLSIRGVIDFPHGRYLRVKLTLGGANPTAWLQMKATVKPEFGS